MLVCNFISAISANYTRKLTEKCGKYIQWRKQKTLKLQITHLPLARAHPSQHEALRQAEAAGAGCLPSSASSRRMHTTRLWSGFGPPRLCGVISDYTPGDAPPFFTRLLV